MTPLRGYAGMRPAVPKQIGKSAASCALPPLPTASRRGITSASVRGGSAPPPQANDSQRVQRRSRSCGADSDRSVGSTAGGSDSEAVDSVADRCAASSAEQSGPIRSNFLQEEFSWGRDFSRYVGDGYIPPDLDSRLQPLELIHQLFEIRKEMKAKLRYESGRVTVRRPGKGRGWNKPVTYASNIWNRGYANCAGLCIVFVSVLQRLGVPYCIVTARSTKSELPKHAVVQVGFPESTDIKAVNRRALELWSEYYGKRSEIRRDPDTTEPRWVKLFRGLKFTRSSSGSTAAKYKGAGRWLWVDPQVKIGYYLHLIEDGYLVQDGDRFSFALTPEIKAWSGSAGIEGHDVDISDLARGGSEGCCLEVDGVASAVSSMARRDWARY